MNAKKNCGFGEEIKKLTEAFKLMPIETNGHRINERSLRASSALRTLDFPEEFINKILLAYEENEPLPYRYPLIDYFPDTCYVCGYELKLETDGVKLYVSNPCTHPEGIPLTFELNVPSGIMAVTDSLHPDFDIEGDYDVNTVIGQVETAKAFEAIGCAHACVGNSCPGIYKIDADKFIIAAPGVNKAGNDVEPSGENVAGIITDLWWYSIVDYDEFKKRGCEGKYEVDLVKVKPGVYEFTHFRHLKNFNYSDGVTIYSEFKWIRPPDPIIDYKEAYEAKNFTAGQIIHDKIKRYPTLYNGPDSIQQAANHIFCVIGGGGDWHKNGFVQYNPDMLPDAPEIDIPVFDKKYNWYPLSEYSALVRAAGLGNESINLNPSFLALARNILNCICKHESTDSAAGKNNVEIAKKCLEKINEKYPFS